MDVDVGPTPSTSLASTQKPQTEEEDLEIQVIGIFKEDKIATLVKIHVANHQKFVKAQKSKATQEMMLNLLGLAQKSQKELQKFISKKEVEHHKKNNFPQMTSDIKPAPAFYLVATQRTLAPTVLSSSNSKAINDDNNHTDELNVHPEQHHRHRRTARTTLAQTRGYQLPMASWAPRRQSARPANGYLLGIRPNRKGLVGLWDPDECDRGAAAPTASRQAAASRDLHRRPGGRPDQPTPASRLACSPSRCSYQPNEQASLLAETASLLAETASLLAEPALVPAQRAG
ncbi:hypothetical protein PCASD_20566 [Puccinia coronata f. sp. avenae]|uniref:Uncharacterized protein n=1 Tax=Puccinia coronata f. sp. avenae TaxID=200324 RepID=A0A2N5TYR1_9BASI|nr:hypothetical protein PCASD_20566 [Puccinia coronata f. sp. avenae]